jgi:peroxiredoxin Q/BCP
MAALKEGQVAPKFRLSAHPEGKVALEDYKGKQHVVLFFYSKGNTPGCTNEAVSFQALLEDFERAGAAVLGISPDDLAAHAKFAEKRGLSFPLLSDSGAKVASKYGVWKERSMYGRTYMGIERTTFVIDPDGRICRIYPKVKIAGHAQAVLEFVQSLKP